MLIAQDYSATRFFGTGALDGDIESWCARQADALPGPATFALVFLSPGMLHRATDILEIVQVYGRVPVIAGCASNGLIAGAHEIENEAGCVVALHHLPGTVARTVYLDAGLCGTTGRDEALRHALGPDAASENGWLLFISPLSLKNESWLARWDAATGFKPTIGGVAHIDPRGDDAMVFENRKCHAEGAVALAIRGAVTIEPLLSQGCRPIGSNWIVTRAENNIIHQIGNRPILEVLRDTLEGMPERDRKIAKGNVFVGLVLDEYKEGFHAGDFLVRNLAAIDPKSGAVAIATPPRIGQNLQFQIRDAASASADLDQALAKLAATLGLRPVYGASLFNCTGRGSGLYGVPDHDIGLIRDRFPNLPVAGIACNGELGPVGGRTFVHGYAASLAFFCGK